MCVGLRHAGAVGNKVVRVRERRDEKNRRSQQPLQALFKAAVFQESDQRAVSSITQQPALTAISTRPVLPSSCRQSCRPSCAALSPTCTCSNSLTLKTRTVPAEL